METWGQAVVQDGGSADHGLVLFQLFSLCPDISSLVSLVIIRTTTSLVSIHRHLIKHLQVVML